MTIDDSRLVLAQLVRSGIWSSLGHLFHGAHKHLVLDADSVITHLYRHCVTSHLKRQRNLKPKNIADYNYYAAVAAAGAAGTLVNYREFSLYVEQMIELFASQSIHLHIVYCGKHMEASLAGPVPAQIKSNTRQVAELLLSPEYPHHNPTGGIKRSPEPNPAAYLLARPPNLARIVFKQIVNTRLRAERGTKTNQRSSHSISTHQAFYSSQPMVAKLARDFKCPVITNKPDFILFDVRAGFVLFEDFLNPYLVSSNSLARHPSTTSLSSNSSTYSTGFNVANKMANNNSSVAAASGAKKQQSPAQQQQLTDTKSLFQQQSRVRARVRIHWHATFLRQHPGLNSSLAAQLFPLTTSEFLVAHAKSLTRMHIYERDYRDKDLIFTTKNIPTKKYHAAAARLEQVFRFMCTKEMDLYVNLMRGEAHRLASNGQTPTSTFANDYRELSNYYVVVHDFKSRLKSILRQRLNDAHQLAHIELCLIERECSPDLLLNALCCSIGLMPAMSYNQSIQGEDLQTKWSAHSMVDASRCAIGSLLSKDQKSDSTKAKTSPSSSQKLPSNLTLVDRVEAKLVERTLKTSNIPTAIMTPKRSQKSAISTTNNETNITIANNNYTKLTLANLARHTSDARQEAANYLEVTFKINRPGTMARLEPIQLEQVISRWVNEHSRHTQQLAILLHLHRYSLQCATHEDEYLKKNYLKLSQPFEMALVNHALYLNHLDHLDAGSGSGGALAQHNSQTMSAIMAAASSPSVPRVDTLRHLIDLINKYDLENVANLNFINERRPADDNNNNTELAKQSQIAKDISGRRLNNLKSSSSKKTSGSSASSSSSSSSSSSKSLSADCKTRTKQIRHLIELLNSSIEAYCELNAFLNYPLPQLNLSSAYNPILIFNLTLYSIEVPNNTKLIKF